MLASENAESGDLLVLAPQLEERALETARQLAQVRVRIGAQESSAQPGASHGRGRQSPSSKGHEATAASHGSSPGSTQKRERHLLDAESRLEQQQQQIEDLQQRETRITTRITTRTTIAATIELQRRFALPT